MQYRRQYQKGGSYFFTLVTHQRKNIFTPPSSIELLRKAFKNVKQKYPFSIDAIVIMPDHIHCIWTLPRNDNNYSNRWRLIKTWFSKHSPHQTAWQKRYWEHQLRDEEDYRKHIEYIHYNPVKHGYVLRPVDWQYSSFHKFVARGVYPENWGSSEIKLPMNVGNE